MSKLKRAITFAVAVGTGSALYCGFMLYSLRLDPDGFDSTYQRLKPHIFENVDPEASHRLAITAAKYGCIPVQQEADDAMLRVSVFGKTFPNVIGLAAGFDKNAEAIPGMLATGFGFVEIGSVLPQPQEGNPRPRVFRLASDKAIINRYGFNSEGMAVVKRRLEAYRSHSWRYHYFPYSPSGIVGVNLGKNKSHEDYVQGVKELGAFADFVVVNVSSPNTPGLRSLQQRDELEALVTSVIQARNQLAPALRRKVPILVKIAPDLSSADLRDIAEVIVNSRVDGVVISNTTVARPLTLASTEQGGLSGAPLLTSATNVLSEFYALTEGRVPLIGVGGVSSGKDAYEKIKAGASLVQLYTGMVYEGPGLPRRIKRELCELLRADGYTSVSQAVGKQASKLKITPVSRSPSPSPPSAPSPVSPAPPPSPPVQPPPLKPSPRKGSLLGLLFN